MHIFKGGRAIFAQKWLVAYRFLHLFELLTTLCLLFGDDSGPNHRGRRSPLHAIANFRQRHQRRRFRVVDVAADRTVHRCATAAVLFWGTEVLAAS